MRLERRDLQLLGIGGRRADGIKQGSHHCPALQSENQGDVVQIVPGPYSDEGQTLVERITEKDGAIFQFALEHSSAALLCKVEQPSASLVMPSLRAEPTSAAGSSAHLDSRGPRGLDPGIEQSLDAR